MLNLDNNEEHKDEAFMAKYNTLYSNLKKKLLKTYKQKKGDKVILSPALLKDLYDIMLMELTPQEISNISPYELQNHVIEQAATNKDFI